MKKTGLIIVLVISLIGVVFGITYWGINKDKKFMDNQIVSNSKVIRYNRCDYQVVPYDLIEENKEYVDILEGLKLD